MLQRSNFLVELYIICQFSTLYEKNDFQTFHFTFKKCLQICDHNTWVQKINRVKISLKSRSFSIFRSSWPEKSSTIFISASGTFRYFQNLYGQIRQCERGIVETVQLSCYSVR